MSSERIFMILLLTLVRDRIRTIDKAYGLEVPTRIAKEYKELCGAEDYLEKKLTELNEKEGLYEAADNFGTVLPSVT